MQGLNYLWHINTNHKLVLWYFIITGVVYGFIQLAVGLSCTDNSKVCTILSIFSESCQRLWPLSKLSSDKGRENVLVADYIMQKRETAGGSVITGRNTHNQRVQRLFKNILAGCNQISTLSFISWKMKVF